MRGEKSFIPRFKFAFNSRKSEERSKAFDELFEGRNASRIPRFAKYAADAVVVAAAAAIEVNSTEVEQTVIEKEAVVVSEVP